MLTEKTYSSKCLSKCKKKKKSLCPVILQHVVSELAYPQPSPVSPVNKDSFNMGCDAPADIR